MSALPEFPSPQHHELHQAALKKRNGTKPDYCSTLDEARNLLVAEIATLYSSGEKHVRWYVDVKTFEVEGLTFDPMTFLAGRPIEVAKKRLQTMFGDAFFPSLHPRLDTTQFTSYKYGADLVHSDLSVCRFSVDLIVEEVVIPVETLLHT